MIRNSPESDASFDAGATAEEFARLRRLMVECDLRPRGIDDLRVLNVMLRVPREQFLPAHLVGNAYRDGAQPIGHQQTISQPFTVAYMCQAARLTGDEKVLEVGTGSGYGAAVLSGLARQVYTIERIDALAEQARFRLARLGYQNVTVVTGDGSLGLPQHAPFDAIVVTAAARQLPRAYKEQISQGGRIVIPIGDVWYGQAMYCFTRRGDRFEAENLGGFAFVPLVEQHSEEEGSS